MSATASSTAGRDRLAECNAANGGPVAAAAAAAALQEQEQCSQQPAGAASYKQHARITISSKHINSFII